MKASTPPRRCTCVSWRHRWDKPLSVARLCVSDSHPPVWTPQRALCSCFCQQWGSRDHSLKINTPAVWRNDPRSSGWTKCFFWRCRFICEKKHPWTLNFAFNIVNLKLPRSYLRRPTTAGFIVSAAAVLFGGFSVFHSKYLLVKQLMW